MAKGDANVMWVIIGAVLAIMVLVVYSYLTGGIIKKVADSLFSTAENSGDQLECSVVPWRDGDINGDGIKDVERCKKYTRSGS